MSGWHTPTNQGKPMTDPVPQPAPPVPPAPQKQFINDKMQLAILFLAITIAVNVGTNFLKKQGLLTDDQAKEVNQKLELLKTLAQSNSDSIQETKTELTTAIAAKEGVVSSAPANPPAPRTAAAAAQLHVRDLQGTELASLAPGVPCMAVTDDGSEVVVSQSKSVRYKVDSGWLVIPESGDVIGFYGAGQMRVFLVAGKDASPESSIQSRVDDVEKSVDGLAANVEAMRSSMVDLAKELKASVESVDAASKRIAALEGARPPPDVQPDKVSGLAINCAVKYLAAMSAASDRAAKRLRAGDSEKAVIVEMGESFNSAMLNSYLPLTDKMNTLKTAGDKAAELESWSKQWTQPAVQKLAE